MNMFIIHRWVVDTFKANHSQLIKPRDLHVNQLLQTHNGDVGNSSYPFASLENYGPYNLIISVTNMTATTHRIVPGHGPKHFRAKYVTSSSGRKHISAQPNSVRRLTTEAGIQIKISSWNVLGEWLAFVADCCRQDVESYLLVPSIDVSNPDDLTKHFFSIVNAY